MDKYGFNVISSGTRMSKWMSNEATEQFLGTQNRNKSSSSFKNNKNGIMPS